MFFLFDMVSVVSLCFAVAGSLRGLDWTFLNTG